MKALTLLLSISSLLLLATNNYPPDEDCGCKESGYKEITPELDSFLNIYLEGAVPFGNKYPVQGFHYWKGFERYQFKLDAFIIPPGENHYYGKRYPYKTGLVSYSIAEESTYQPPTIGGFTIIKTFSKQHSKQAVRQRLYEQFPGLITPQDLESSAWFSNWIGLKTRRYGKDIYFIMAVNVETENGSYSPYVKFHFMYDSTTTECMEECLSARTNIDFFDQG